MSKIENQTFVPEWRFPEFTGKWNEKELGQLSTILRGGSPRPIDNFLTKDKKALNWLKIGDVDKDAKYISMTQERVKVEALSKTRVVNSGDLIMSNSMSFGRPYIMKIQSCIHDGWIAVTDVSQSIDVNYLYYFILSDASQSYFLNSAAGGGIKNLNADIIKKTPVFYAEDIKEQKKIADTLSSIDNLITANIKKLESLKSHKKGLMQKLFPAEGENKPDFRFPEFSMEVNWKKEKLHNLVDLLSGHAFKSEYFSTTGKKMVTPKNFTKNGFASFSEDNTKYTSEDFNERYICREGDLLLLLTDLTPSCELLGRPMLLTPSDGEVLLNQRIAKVILKGNINSNFLKYFFLSNSFRKRIINTATGSTVRHTSNKIVLSTELLLPNLSEQNKIAVCLLSIDELIRSQADKIETLKEYKKGLMQQLFPEMKESIA
ncbi:restriction endonuclease subunit S [Vibrio vulnificus]|nr:restriction endonuclease subunit S [Vibrio vulnificus]